MSETLTLKSSDSIQIRIDPEFAKLSTEITKLLAEGNTATGDIPIPHNSVVISKVVEWWQFHNSNIKETDSSDLGDEDREPRDHFDEEMLFDLILAAMYFNLDALADTLYESVATMMQERTTEDLRMVFGIIPDVKYTEEEQMWREDNWDKFSTGTIHESQDILAYCKWPRGYTFAVERSRELVELKPGRELSENQWNEFLERRDLRDVKMELNFLKKYLQNSPDSNPYQSFRLIWTANTGNGKPWASVEFAIGNAIERKIVWLSDLKQWVDLWQPVDETLGNNQGRWAGRTQLLDLSDEALKKIVGKLDYGVSLRLSRTCKRLRALVKNEVPKTLTIYLFKTVDPKFAEIDGPIVPTSTVLDILIDPLRAEQIRVLQFRLIGFVNMDTPATDLDQLLERLRCASKVHTVRYLVQEQPEEPKLLTLQRPYRQSWRFKHNLIWEAKGTDKLAYNDDFDEEELEYHRQFLSGVEKVEVLCPSKEVESYDELENLQLQSPTYPWNESWEEGWNVSILGDSIKWGESGRWNQVLFGKAFLVWNFQKVSRRKSYGVPFSRSGTELFKTVPHD